MAKQKSEPCSCPRCTDCECCDEPGYPGHDAFGRQLWSAHEAVSRELGRDLEREPLGEYLLTVGNEESRWWGFAFLEVSQELTQGEGLFEMVPEKAVRLVGARFMEDKKIFIDATREEAGVIGAWAKKLPGWDDNDMPLMCVPRPSE